MGLRLGEMLHLERGKRGHSLRVAAGEIGVTHNTLHNWERGTLPKQARHLVAIAQYLGLAVAEIVALVKGQ